MTDRFVSFDPKALAFLRALKRNNDREWFRARKEQYELLLRDPMLRLVDRVGGDLRTFAPELSANPKRSLFRIYRDTRFSEDKRPLKTHVAAVFPPKDVAWKGGAGLYVEVAAGWVWAGGGMYAPETSQLQAIREHIGSNHRRLRTIIESPSFKRVVGSLAGERLQRVPRGFAKDHPAAELLTFRQFIAGREFPADLACRPRFYATVVGVFREVAPLIRFLNEALLG